MYAIIRSLANAGGSMRRTSQQNVAYVSASMSCLSFWDGLLDGR